MEFLEGRFPEPFLTLPAAAHRQLILDATQYETMGGSIYDALVAATARHAGARLLSLDRRAASIYRRLGVEFKLL